MKFQNLAKGFLGAALGLTLAFGAVTPAMAATITINNTNAGETYKAYKLFDVTVAGSNYSYSTTNSDLVDVLKTIGLTFDTSADKLTYYVLAEGEGDDAVFKTDPEIDPDGQMTAAELAEALNGIANQLGSPAATEKVADGHTSITLGDGIGDGDAGSLNAGYYFVTSTMGSLCFLQTNNEEVKIDEKTAQPTVEKTVDDATNNSVEVGDVLDYVITVHAQAGAKDYVLRDTLSDGLTLNQSNIAVSAKPAGSGAESASLVSGTDYTINPTVSGFTITFSTNFLNGIKVPTDITVTYQATVNENAVVGTNPNTNEAVLDYGGSSHTTSANTSTWVYDFDISKLDDEGKPLSGAEFELYNDETGGEPIQFVLDNGAYRVATDDEIDTGRSITTIAVDESGHATVTGLEGKNYWLEETEAPQGYNKLSARQEVFFEKKGDSFSSNSDFKNPEVVNKSGSLLPSTGGMGTTALYAVGAVLVVGAGVTLVVRRRAHHEA